MIYMYVLDSTVLQQGVSDTLFEKQWEIYQSRVNGHSVGPVPCKSVLHYWQEVSALSASESAQEVEPTEPETEVVNSVAPSQPEQEDNEACMSELPSNDQQPQLDEPPVATELPLEIEGQKENEIIITDTTAADDVLGTGSLDKIPESLAEAKSEEAVQETERYMI